MRAFWISALIILVDQVTKLLVYFTMYRGESIPVLGDWLRLTYTLNPGMAFGITFGPPGLITIFAIAATILILFYIFHVRNGYAPYRYSLALILGGAFGNIIDRVFYAKLFGYGELFTGQVIDFIHVNLWRGYIPESVPLLGGTYAALFPIWNVADMAIVIGVVGILVFQRQFHIEQQAAMDEARADASPREPGEAQPENAPEGQPQEERRAREHVDDEGAPIQTTVDPSDFAPLRWDRDEASPAPPASDGADETSKKPGESAS